LHRPLEFLGVAEQLLALDPGENFGELELRPEVLGIDPGGFPEAGTGAVVVTRIEVGVTQLIVGSAVPGCCRISFLNSMMARA
jgi:hypothetical protein